MIDSCFGVTGYARHWMQANYLAFFRQTLCLLLLMYRSNKLLRAAMNGASSGVCATGAVARDRLSVRLEHNYSATELLKLVPLGTGILLPAYCCLLRTPHSGVATRTAAQTITDATTCLAPSSAPPSTAQRRGDDMIAAEAIGDLALETDE